MHDTTRPRPCARQATAIRHRARSQSVAVRDSAQACVADGDVIPQNLGSTVPLRVALDYRPALLSVSGIGRATRQLAAALAERPDLELHLYGHSLARTVNGARPATAHLHRLPVPGRSLPLLRALGIGADRLCGRPRVFHALDYVEVPVRDARLVVTIHDVAFAEDPALHGPRQSQILIERTRRILRQAQRVVVPTATTAAALREHFDVDPTQLAVIPFGVDHVPRDQHDEPPLRGEDYVLMLGTLEPRKNHLRLLRAWRSLAPPRPRLVVIGQPGWLCDEVVGALRATAREGVRWIPQADDATVWRYLRHARALAYPSLREGFGFPPLEALSLGIPVLAGDTPALREVLGDAALFRDPTSVDTLRDGLELVLGDERCRARLKSRGAVRAASYTWANCAQAHAALYAEVAQ
jgi:glycosyltransferase involved in cell wall biosynthesis